MDRAQQQWLNDGAQRERRAVRGWLKRHVERYWSILDLLDWLADRTKRYRKAKGGLGRRAGTPLRARLPATEAARRRRRTRHVI